MKKTMTMILAVVVAALLLSPLALASEPKKPVSAKPEAQALIDKGWDAQDQDMGLKQIDETIKYMEQALKLDPNNQELLVELADEYYQRGDQMPMGSDENFEARAKYFTTGLDYAKQAMAVKETAGAHYWSAANLAAMNENNSIISQAAIFPELNTHMEWIEAHDQHYKYGGYARFWSRVVTRVPAIVIKMVGQDPDQPYGQLTDAINSEPRFIDNYAYLAEFQHNRGKKDEALATLDKALKMDPGAFPEERAYNRYAQKKAKEHWKEWTGKEYPNK
ncbi:MAG TPA: TRAP transporter TatT component family protein [bacterium]|nr:TRAP transporter TatT component family protein [bacterium]